MTETRESEDVRRLRAFEVLSEVDTPVIPVSKAIWRVHSQSGRGYYTVRNGERGWVCDCQSFEAECSRTGSTPCKHIYVVKIWLQPSRYTQHQGSRGPRSPSYSQNWPAYDAAQQDEHILFDPLLWSLLEGVPEPQRPLGMRGRPPVPLRTQLLLAIKKVHLGESMRRVRGLLEVVYGSGSGLIAAVPNYAVPSRLFNRQDSGELLLDLIRRSAQPLRELEGGGTVAIDSTGFCTTCMGSYCTEKHNPGRKHRWVKAHTIIGVKTHIILDVQVTDENGADCPQFASLLTGAKASGFNPGRVVADKAYLSKDNYALADSLGIEPVIPFKKDTVSNEVRRVRGEEVPPAWERAYHLFQLKRGEFASRYHQRSNVEMVLPPVAKLTCDSTGDSAWRSFVDPLLLRIAVSHLAPN